MATILPFTGGKRCYVCSDQIHPTRVRENPDIATCDAGCAVAHEYNKAALFGAPAQISQQQASSSAEG